LNSFIPQDVSGAEIAAGVAAAAAIVGYVAFILAPAWSSYGRLWERLAASVLTVYILAALLGLGVALGFAVVYSYDSWAGP
jgi:hypothetical protein